MAGGWGVNFGRLIGLSQAFKAFSGGFEKELEESMEELVEMIAQTARDETVPVDTGALRGSIRTAVKRAGKAFIEGEVSAGGIDNVDYAIFVHEGTIDRAARPFLVQALNQHKRDVEKLFGESITKAIQANLLGNILRRGI